MRLSRLQFSQRSQDAPDGEDKEAVQTWVWEGPKSSFISTESEEASGAIQEVRSPAKGGGELCGEAT